MRATASIVREFERRDSEKPYVELIDGIEVPKMSPATRHGLLQRAFLVALDPWAKTRGICGAEIRFWLRIDGARAVSLLPDIAFVSYERLAPLDDEERERIPFAPDLAVEIRSAGDRERNIARKIESYLAFGSILVLDIDPQREIVIAHDGGSPNTFGNGAILAHRLLPEFSLDVAAFFRSGDSRQP